MLSARDMGSGRWRARRSRTSESLPRRSSNLSCSSSAKPGRPHHHPQRPSGTNDPDQDSIPADTAAPSHTPWAAQACAGTSTPSATERTQSCFSLKSPHILLLGPQKEPQMSFGKPVETKLRLMCLSRAGRSRRRQQAGELLKGWVPREPSPQDPQWPPSRAAAGEGWRGLEGAGRGWRGLKQAGRAWRGLERLEGTGRGWKWLEGTGRGLEGARRGSEALFGAGSLACPQGSAQAYLAKDVLNVASAQLVALQVEVFHDVPVPGSDAAVLALVTAAEVVIVRAKLQGQEGLEGGPVIQTLGVSLEQARPAQHDCEAEAENSRSAQEPGGLRTPRTAGSGEHRGGARALRSLGSSSGSARGSLRPCSCLLPSSPPSSHRGFAEVVSEPRPWGPGSCLLRKR